MVKVPPCTRLTASTIESSFRQLLELLLGDDRAGVADVQRAGVAGDAGFDGDETQLADTFDAMLGRHEDPRARRVAPEGPARVVSVYDGEIAIEHDHVVVDRVHARECATAVVRHVDRHILAAQPACDRIGEVLLVLDNQHAHAVSFSPGHS
jgi:hypothetical protein